MTNVFLPHANDGLSIGELDLYHRLEAHRASQGLASVPLSRALTLTSNRHLIDLEERGVFEHEWGPATGLDQWTDAKVLGGFPDIGFEILSVARNSAGAMINWAASPAHMREIENAGNRSVGIALDGSKASVYWGGVVDPTGAPDITGTDGADSASLTAFGDRAFGMAGNDTFSGMAGDDVLYGNMGEDALYGDAGSDVVFGGQGGDLVFGGIGDDALYGNMANDVVYGGDGADTLFGGQGDDILVGEDGADWMAGNLGNDTLTGGAGADRFVFSASGEADVIADFRANDGDRIVVAAGQQVVAGTAADGSLLLALGGATVVLQGVGPAAFDAGWIVAG